MSAEIKADAHVLSLLSRHDVEPRWYVLASVPSGTRSIMKKASTGERIKITDLRRRSVGGPRGDTDSDVTTEQLFVSELMDVTPSSSYDGETWRGSYGYNPHDTPVCDSTPYESDTEAADEVVTGTQKVVGKADLIVKEDVPEVRGD